MKRNILAALPLQPLNNIIKRDDKFIPVAVPFDKVCEREGVSASHKTPANRLGTFATIGMQQYSDRHRCIVFFIAERQREDRLPALAPRFSTIKIADLAETVTQNGTVASLAGRRIEVDKIVIVARHDDLDAVENGTFASTGRTDHGDHAGHVEVEYLEGIPVMEGEASQLVGQGASSGSIRCGPGSSTLGSLIVSRFPAFQAKKSSGAPSSTQFTSDAANVSSTNMRMPGNTVTGAIRSIRSGS